MFLLCMLLPLLLVSAAQSQELISDGDFASHPRRVTAGAFMVEFPGSKTTALAVLPTDSAATVVGASGTRSTIGWYRVQLFAHALHGYGDLPLIVDVLGSGEQMAPPFSIPLRPTRGEWLHYDVHVPCNPTGNTAPRLTVQSSASSIQITGLSITWVSFGSRQLRPLSWTSSGAQASCPSGSNDAVRETTLSNKAFDNDDATSWLIASEVPPGSGEYPTMALEIEFSSVSLVCGARVVFDSTNYPRSWKMMAKEGDGSVPTAWSTWIDVRSSWPTGAKADTIASGVPVLTTLTDASAGSNQILYMFGRDCTQAHRLRLEISDATAGLFFKTYEIELVTPGPGSSSPATSCSCRHGGVCVNGGHSCACPASLGKQINHDR
jgi:hypothetical protein